ncbi:hypothetical protein [Rhizobium sp. AC44/96]|uniref:hypothetical protein n=1 Tax=Rhizobium sp. AC44/96 TaxID=1841654 RepID=UPI001301511C|nr:hypothetical protein [Rhizobium sp. AC44/96]
MTRIGRSRSGFSIIAGSLARAQPGSQERAELARRALPGPLQVVPQPAEQQEPLPAVPRVPCQPALSPLEQVWPAPWRCVFPISANKLRPRSRLSQPLRQQSTYPVMIR